MGNLFRNHRATSGFPPAQDLLWRAALGDGFDVAADFAAWKRDRQFVHYRDIDHISSWWLPAVHANLLRAGQNDPWLPQMAGLARHRVLEGARLQRTVVSALDALQHAGGRLALIGAFALRSGAQGVGRAYPPPRAADVLIDPADAPLRRRTLAELGWRSARRDSWLVPGWRSEPWWTTDGARLTLHYSLVPRRYPIVSLNDVWTSCRTSELGAVSVQVPSSSDLLTQLAVRGFSEVADAPAWIAELVWLLRRDDQHQHWNQLLEVAESRELLATVHHSLALVHVRFKAPVPVDWLRQAEKRILQAARPKPWLGGLRRSVWKNYVRAEQAAGRRATAWGRLRYAAWKMSRTGD